MKKLILLAVITFALLSCKKEDVKPTNYTFTIECESCTIQINDKYYTLHDYALITDRSKQYVKLTTTLPNLSPFKLSINNRSYSGYISEYYSFELKNLH